MDRAYSLLKWKSIDDDQRIIEGVATTPSTDRQDDIVEPRGATYKLPLPLLYQHDSHQPIGHVIAAKVTDAGILIKAQIAKGVLPKIDDVWALIKAGLVRGLSIGFRPLETSDIEGSRWGRRFVRYEILELSACTIPANSEATITSVKSIEKQLLAALGQEQSPTDRQDANHPGASGKSARKGFSLIPKGTEMKTIQEQIAALEAARAAKSARMTEIMTKGIEEGRSTDEAEAQEFDGLKAEVRRSDDDLSRLRELEKMNVAAARQVPSDPVEQARAAAEGKPYPYLQIRSNLPKGTAFTRYVMALTRSKGNAFSAAETAKQWTDTPEVARVLKAASDAGTTTDATWAASLVDYTNMATEFVELLRPATILGKFGTNGIPDLRRVPFNIRMATQTGGGTYQWVGQGNAKPVGELSIGEMTLKWAKAAGIIVVTEELMRFSTPSIEAIVRNDMIKGMAAYSDSQFVNPDVPEVADLNPASVFNGVTPVTASGTDIDALRADINTLLDPMDTASQSIESGVWIMSSRQARRIGAIRNALGAKEAPDLTSKGGFLEGFPVITSEGVPDDSNGGMIGFVVADDIYFSDDGPVTIDASREASLQMNTTPDNPATASTVMISLWQRNMIALRAERYMNWKKRRPTAAGYIQGANYSGAV